MFENKRYIARGVSQKVDLPLQLFMWQCIDELDVPKDYLQVFKLSIAEGKQKIEHIQEEPECKYKPETIFYGEGKLFYGIELEIDKGGEDDINARKILDVANGDEERIYCKHDGSIDDGFEIVSPVSL